MSHRINGMYNNPLPIRKFLAPIILLGLLLVGFLVWQQLQFHLVSTNPKTSTVSKISPFITLNFSKALDSTNTKLVMDNTFMSDYTVKGKQITITLKQMYVGKTYIITVQKAQSQKGEILTNMTIKFTAKDIAFQDLPEDQQKAILERQDKAPKATNDPIVKYLPYSTLSYTISSLVRTPSTTNPTGLYIHADIYLSNAELSGDTQTAINQYEQEVVDYIRSKGLDPAKYAIEYNIVSQSTNTD